MATEADVQAESISTTQTAQEKIYLATGQSDKTVDETSPGEVKKSQETLNLPSETAKYLAETENKQAAHEGERLLESTSAAVVVSEETSAASQHCQAEEEPFQEDKEMSETKKQIQNYTTNEVAQETESRESKLEEFKEKSETKHSRHDIMHVTGTSFQVAKLEESNIGIREGSLEEDSYLDHHVEVIEDQQDSTEDKSIDKETRAMQKNEKDGTKTDENDKLEPDKQVFNIAEVTLDQNKEASIHMPDPRATSLNKDIETAAEPSNRAERIEAKFTEEVGETISKEVNDKEEENSTNLVGEEEIPEETRLSERVETEKDEKARDGDEELFSKPTITLAGDETNVHETGKKLQEVFCTAHEEKNDKTEPSETVENTSAVEDETKRKNNIDTSFAVQTEETSLQKVDNPELLTVVPRSWSDDVIKGSPEEVQEMIEETAEGDSTSNEKRKKYENPEQEESSLMKHEGTSTVTEELDATDKSSCENRDEGGSTVVTEDNTDDTKITNGLEQKHGGESNREERPDILQQTEPETENFHASLSTDDKDSPMKRHEESFVETNIDSLKQSQSGASNHDERSEQLKNETEKEKLDGDFRATASTEYAEMIPCAKDEEPVKNHEESFAQKIEEELRTCTGTIIENGIPKDKVHDGTNITGTGEAINEQVRIGSVTYNSLESTEHETVESSQHIKNEAEKSEGENNTKNIIEDDNIGGLVPTPVEQDPVKNLDDKKKKTEKSTAGVSWTMNQTPTEASSEEKINEDINSYHNEIDDAKDNTENKPSESEEDLQYILHKKKSGEKLDESLPVIADDTEIFSSSSDKIPCLMEEGGLPNFEETAHKEEKVNETEGNNEATYNQIAKDEGLKLVAETSESSTKSRVLEPKSERDKMVVEDDTKNGESEELYEDSKSDGDREDTEQQNRIEEFVTRSILTEHFGEKSLQSFKKDQQELKTEVCAEPELTSACEHAGRQLMEEENTAEHCKELEVKKIAQGSEEDDTTANITKQDNVTFISDESVEQEIVESSQGNITKAEKSEPENRREQIIEEGNIGQDPTQNSSDERQETEKSTGEIFENSDTAEAVESTAHGTSKTTESPKEVLDTSPVKQEENLLSEGKATEASLEENKNEDISPVMVAEEDTKKKSLRNEEYFEPVLQRNADETPSLTVERASQNLEETAQKEDKTKESDEAKRVKVAMEEDLNVVVQTSDASKSVECIVLEPESKLDKLVVEDDMKTSESEEVHIEPEKNSIGEDVEKQILIEESAVERCRILEAEIAEQTSEEDDKIANMSKQVVEPIEQEKPESSRGNTSNAEKPEAENDKEETMEDIRGLIQEKPESVKQHTVKNLNDEKTEAEKSSGEICENPKMAEGAESSAQETIQTSDIIDTSLAKQKDDFQSDGDKVTPTDASTDETRNKDVFPDMVAQENSSSDELLDAKDNIEKNLSKSEEDLEHILQKNEPGEKLDQQLSKMVAETEAFSSNADITPQQMEEGGPQNEEAVRNKEETVQQNETKDNKTAIEEDLNVVAEIIDASKSKESIAMEPKSEMVKMVDGDGVKNGESKELSENSKNTCKDDDTERHSIVEACHTTKILPEPTGEEALQSFAEEGKEEEKPKIEIFESSETAITAEIIAHETSEATERPKEQLDTSPAVAAESIAHETSEMSESLKEQLDTSPVKQEENLHGEGKTMEASLEEKENEDTSAVMLADKNSNANELVNATDGADKKSSKSEDYLEHILQKHEPGEKLEQSSPITPDEIGILSSNADKTPCLMVEGASQNLEETAQIGDKTEENNEAKHNNIVTDEDVKVVVKTSDASKSIEGMVLEPESELAKLVVDDMKKAESEKVHAEIQITTEKNTGIQSRVLEAEKIEQDSEEDDQTAKMSRQGNITHIQVESIEQEAVESSQSNTNNTETSEAENNTEYNTEVGNITGLIPESVEQDPVKNLNDETTKAEKSSREIFENSKTTKAAESTANDAVESSDVIDTSLDKQRENLQSEGDNLTPTEASQEMKDEDKSPVMVPQESSSFDELFDVKDNIEKNPSKSEEDLEHSSRKNEPGEKLDQPILKVEDETEAFSSNSDKTPWLMEERDSQNEDETEQNSEKIDNKITVEEDLKVVAGASDASKNKESIAFEEKLEMDKKVDGGDIKNRESELSEDLKDTTKSKDIEKQNIEEACHTTSILLEATGEEALQSFAEEVKQEETPKMEIDDSNPSFIEKLEATGSAKETISENSKDRAETNVTRHPLDVTEASEEGKHPKEIKGDLVEESTSLSEALHQESKEEITAKDETKCVHSDTASVTVVKEEAGLQEAEAEERNQVESFGPVSEEKDTAETETREIMLVIGDVKLKPEETSNLSEIVDKDIQVGAGEDRLDKQMQNEIPLEGSEVLEEVTTNLTPLKETLEDELVEYSTVASEEHKLKSSGASHTPDETPEKIHAPDENKETTFLAEAGDEMLMQKHNRTTNPLNVSELRSIDTDKETANEVQKHKVDDLYVHPELENEKDIQTENVEIKKRETSRELSDQSDIFTSKTLQDVESSGLGLKVEEAKDEKPFDEALKCTESSSICTEIEKVTTEQEISEGNLHEDVEVEKATFEQKDEAYSQRHEDISTKDDGTLTEENFKSVDPDQKLHFAPESVAEDQSKQILPESDKSKVEEDDNKKKQQDEKDIKEKEEPTSEAQENKEQNANEITKSVILTEKAPDGVEQLQYTEASECEETKIASEASYEPCQEHDPVKNLNDEITKAENSSREIFENSKTTEAAESTANDAFESLDVIDTSQEIQREILQSEGDNLTIIEASQEQKNEDKSPVMVPQENSSVDELFDVKDNIEKNPSKSEEVLEHTSQKNEPGEKLDQPILKMENETEAFSSNSDKTSWLIEERDSQNKEAARNEEETEQNNEKKDNKITVEEDLKVVAETSDASKNKESIAFEEKLEMDKKLDGEDIKNRESELSENLKDTIKSEDIEKQNIVEACHTTSILPETTGEEELQSFAEEVKQEETPKIEIDDSNPSFIEKIEATGSAKERVYENSKDRAETNVTRHPLDVTEASEEGKHPKEIKGDPVEESTSLSEALYQESNEELTAKEETKCVHSDTASVTVVKEEAGLQEAEAEERNRVERFGPVSEEKDIAETETREIMLEGGDMKLKPEESSNLSEFVDNDILVGAGEDRLDKEMQNEVPFAGSGDLEEVTTNVTPLKETLEDELIGYSTIASEEHKVKSSRASETADETPEEIHAPDENKETTFLAEAGDEMLMQKHDRTTNPLNVSELRSIDTDKETANEVQKHKVDVLYVYPEIENEKDIQTENVEIIKRETTRELTDQSDIFTSKTLQDVESSDLGLKVEEAKDEKPFDETLKCTESSSICTEIEKVTTEQEISEGNLHEGVEVEKATIEQKDEASSQRHEDISTKDDETLTAENFKSADPDQKLDFAPESVAEDQSTQILPESDRSKVEEDDNKKKQQDEREMTGKEEPTSEAQENKEQNVNEITKSIILSEKAPGGVEQLDDHEDIKELDIEKKQGEDELHALSTVGEVTNQVKDSTPVCSDAKVAESKEKTDTENSEVEEDLTGQREAFFAREPEEQKLQDVSIEPPAEELGEKIKEKSLDEPKDCYNQNDSAIIAPKQCLETSETENSHQDKEIDLMKLEETSCDLAPNLPTVQDGRAEEESSTVENTEASECGETKIASEASYEPKGQGTEKTDVGITVEVKDRVPFYGHDHAEKENAAMENSDKDEVEETKIASASDQGGEGTSETVKSPTVDELDHIQSSNSEHAEKESMTLENPKANEVNDSKVSSDAIYVSKDQGTEESAGKNSTLEIPAQIQASNSEHAENESVTEENPDADDADETKEASHVVLNSEDEANKGIEENRKTPTAENQDAYTNEEEHKVTSDYKAHGGEPVGETEIIIDPTMSAEKLEEKLPSLTSATIEVEKREEEKTEKVDKLEGEGPDGSSVSKPTDDISLKKEVSRELEVSTLGLKISKDIQVSPTEVREEEGQSPDAASQVVPKENHGITESKDTEIEERNLVTVVTDKRAEEKQPKQSSEANEITNNEVSNEEIADEKEVAETHHSISACEETLQEDNPQAEERVGEKENTKYMNSATGIQNEELPMSNASKNIEEQVTTEDRSLQDPEQVSVVNKTIKESSPNEFEGKVAAVKLTPVNQREETNFAIGKAEITTPLDEESGIEISQKEGDRGFLNSSKLVQEIQELRDNTSATTKEQIPTEEDVIEGPRTTVSTGNEYAPSVLQEGTTEARDFEPEHVKGVHSEPKGIKHEGEKITGDSEGETLEESPKMDTDKSSLSALLPTTQKETPQVANQVTKETEPTTSSEELQNKEAENIQVREARTGEEKQEEEEGDEHKKTEVISDSPVMVEITRDMDVKVHKKSHGILSGVGSKVKHSISKVKKAITGKSSHHPKPVSPK